MHQLLLIIHLVAATIWIGGHLILCLGILPRAIKTDNPNIILQFEKQFEPIGIPALLLLVISGILLSLQYDITISKWFTFTQSIEMVISYKLILLLIIFMLALHARFILIPKLTIENMYKLGWHIVLVTLLSVSMLVLGSSIRFGGI
ncbi:MAG: CopD family protein [Bacteroidia bacterium]|jgi:putative copper export protein|nr:CopD family protein [Bacteroidia bacterium]